MIRLLSGLLLLLLTFATRAQPPAGTRLETEYKLAVPAGQETALWLWLRTTYATSKPVALGSGWTATLGEERFEDQYYDDTRRTLLHADAGLRYRRRYENGRLKKALVQLKTANDSAGMMRQELKFKLAGSSEAPEKSGVALAVLMASADQSRLTDALRPLGVSAAELAPSLALTQRRLRLYLQFEAADFATITLDSVYHAAQPAATFTEVEIELNEKRFTGASAAERVQMQGILVELKADLERQFPGLKQDQRPKYQKLAALLPATVVPAPHNLPAAPTNEQPGPRAPFWIGGALAGLAIGWWLMRRQRVG